MRQFGTRFKLPITLAALAVFIGGIGWSVAHSDLQLSEIHPLPLLITAIVLVPLGLVVAAWNLCLLGRVVGTRISFGSALAATAYGRVAEVLPIPGAALVRGFALINAGAGTKASAGVLIQSAILSLAMAGLASSPPLITRYALVGWLIALGSLLVTVICLRWIGKRTDLQVVVFMVAVRLATIALSCLRFYACFAALGVGVPLLTTMIFVIATTLTTMSGIVPAGLGISESLSAGLALTVGIASSAAFLAAALNRILGLSVSAAIALAIWQFAPREEPETA